jgi:hypothetical protein
MFRLPQSQRSSHGILVALVISLLWLCSPSVAQQKQPMVTFFHGNRVSFAMPALGSGEHLALGPVVVCIASVPIPQCYTPPKANPPFGTDPKAKVIQLKSGLDALLFEVSATAGGSGSTHLLALLEPGKGKYLSNLTPDVTFGDQGEYRFWNVPSISDMPVLVLADASWGSGETHFSRHRFFVTVFSFDPTLHVYSLRDKYLTSGKYASFDEVDVINVLEPEREKILARLKRQRY